MTSRHSNFLAIRAIIAVLIRITLGRVLVFVVAVSTLVALLSGYNASRGMSLLWIIFILALLTAAASGIALVLAYVITAKILPRKLTMGEKRRIARFARDIRGRLIMLRVPLPLMVWHLLIQVAAEVHESREQNKLENTIKQSKSLSQEFAIIRKYFS